MDEEAMTIKGKKHGFSDLQDENRPAQYWFQESTEGLVLFVVFYTEACRWSNCIGCNLPSKCSSRHIGYKALMNQVDWLFANPDIMSKSSRIRKMILSNNGSIFDEATFSSTALIYCLAQMNRHVSHLSTLTIETRPEYVDVAELEYISRTIKEGDTPTELEIAIGFEIFDDHLRNNVFRKGLYLGQLEEFAAKVGKYRYRLKCYFMQKPVPDMTDEDAITDVRNGIEYLDRISRKYGANINMHLNPTYAARGTLLEDAFLTGHFTPPRLSDVAKAVSHAKGKSMSVYIGLYDEGLAVPGGSFLREGEDWLVKKLERFNQTHDFAFLENQPEAASSRA